MDTSKDGWFVITGRIVTGEDCKFQSVYYSDRPDAGELGVVEHTVGRIADSDDEMQRGGE